MWLILVTEKCGADLQPLWVVKSAARAGAKWIGGWGLIDSLYMSWQAVFLDRVYPEWQRRRRCEPWPSLLLKIDSYVDPDGRRCRPRNEIQYWTKQQRKEEEYCLLKKKLGEQKGRRQEDSQGIMPPYFADTLSRRGSRPTASHAETRWDSCCIKTGLLHTTSLTGTKSSSAVLIIPAWNH